MHVRMHIRMHVYMHVCVCVCMYVCMHVCVCARARVHKHTTAGGQVINRTRYWWAAQERKVGELEADSSFSSCILQEQQNG